MTFKKKPAEELITKTKNKMQNEKKNEQLIKNRRGQ